MTSRPVLNHDILLEVVAASSWADCAGLLDTCRFLHFDGPTALLRKAVHLDTKGVLHRFLAFLRRGLDDARYKSVRDLHLGLSGMTNKASSELVFALSRMVNLSSLALSSSEYLFGNRPGLLSAFATLTSLRVLWLPEAGEHTVKFLQSCRSNLVSVNINFPPECDEDGFFDEDVTREEEWPKYHPAVLFAHSRSTLRELECERWYTHPEILPEPSLVYPEMRRLKMSSASPPLTVALVRAYPKLAYLSIHTGEGDDGGISDREYYAAHRDKNLRAQGAPGCSWNTLGEYNGALVDLYLLGLTCPIERVELRALRQKQRYMLDPVLSLARPRHLVLHGWPGLPESSAADAFVALQGPGGSRLESLSVDAWLYEKDKNVDIVAAMENLMSSLEHAPLRVLDFVIRLSMESAGCNSVADRFLCEVDDEEGDEGDEEIDEEGDEEGDEEDDEEDDLKEDFLIPSRPSNPNPGDHTLPVAERSVDEFDIGDYLRRLARVVPTLERATIRMYRSPGRGKGKKATMTNGEVCVES